MSKKRYSIGLDFGTLSARAVLVDVENGVPLPYASVFYYPHAVMTELCGRHLPSHYALQHPNDYIEALKFLLCDVTENNSIDKSLVIGIGIDFTDCTVLPVNKELTPLCMLDKYKNEPHAYAKLWKHHAKEEYTKKISDVAEEDYPELLTVTGGKITSEFLIPKLYEIYLDAPEVYADTYKFISAGDFAASSLTGKKELHSKAFSAKQHYRDTKYPSKEFFSAIDEGFSDVYEKKTVTSLSSVEEPIGYLSSEWADLTGLSRSVAVSAPIVDANGAIAASGIDQGRAYLVLGTSATVEIVTASDVTIRGSIATSYESVAKELYTIESALAAVGDLFDWFVKNCVPEAYFRAAQEKGLDIHAYLSSLAEKQAVGEHKLIALDWWNGSRSVVLDNRLSGLIVGLRLSTKPEDIYRALIESTIFSIRKIFDCFKEQEISVNLVSATGGITLKNPLLMQICASVLGLPIECLNSKHATAIGASIYGAVAGGAYASVIEASQNMKCSIAKTYYPIKEDNEKYEKIYAEYEKLRDAFCDGTLNTMKYLFEN